MAASGPAGSMSRSGRGSTPRPGPSPRFPETRHFLSPRTGPLTTPQASRHATDRIIAPPCRAFDAGLQFGPGSRLAARSGNAPGCYPDRTFTGRRRRA